MADLCRVQDCENPQRNKVDELCHKHDERNRRNGDPEVSGWAVRSERAKQARAEETERTCRDCQETKPVTDYYVNKSGWRYLHCKRCHHILRMAKLREQRERNPKPRKPRPKVLTGPCTFKGCERDAVTTIVNGPDGGYCHTHYQQWHSTKRLFPIRAREASYINEDERRCTSCDEVKRQEEFYDRQVGGKQAHCKECAGLIARFNTFKRVGDFVKAAEILSRMPDHIKGRYSERLDKAIESTGGKQ